jgi:hypothetical protein
VTDPCLFAHSLFFTFVRHHAENPGPLRGIHICPFEGTLLARLQPDDMA